MEKQIPGGVLKFDGEFISLLLTELTEKHGSPKRIIFRCTDEEIFNRVESIKDMWYEYEIFNLQMSIEALRSNLAQWKEIAFKRNK